MNSVTVIKAINGFWLALLLFSPSQLFAEESMTPTIETRQEYFCPQTSAGSARNCGYFPVQKKVCIEGYWLAANGFCYRKARSPEGQIKRSDAVVSEVMNLVNMLNSPGQESKGILMESRAVKYGPKVRDLSSTQDNATWIMDGI